VPVAVGEGAAVDENTGVENVNPNPPAALLLGVAAAEICAESEDAGVNTMIGGIELDTGTAEETAVEEEGKGRNVIWPLPAAEEEEPVLPVGTATTTELGRLVAAGATHPVAVTVTTEVDTRVTVTIPSVPMTTVGVAIAGLAELVGKALPDADANWRRYKASLDEETDAEGEAEADAEGEIEADAEAESVSRAAVKVMKTVVVTTLSSSEAAVLVAGLEAVGVADFTVMAVGVLEALEDVVSSSHWSSPSSSVVVVLLLPSSSQSSSSSLPSVVVVVVVLSLPVVPPVTPASWKRCTASSNLSQTMAVPFLRTSGKAKHRKSAGHGVKTHLPETHCANWLVTQAMAPSVSHGSSISSYSENRLKNIPSHESVTLMDANCKFSACASNPFCLMISVEPVALEVAAGAAVEETLEAEDMPLALSSYCRS